MKCNGKFSYVEGYDECVLPAGHEGAHRFVSPSARPAAEEPESQPGEGGPCAGCGVPFTATAADVAWTSDAHDLGVAECPRCRRPAIVKLDPVPTTAEGECKTCARCEGSGCVVEAGRQIVTCPDCKGMGSLPACARPGEKGAKP